MAATRGRPRIPLLIHEHEARERRDSTLGRWLPAGAEHANIGRGGGRQQAARCEARLDMRNGVQREILAELDDLDVPQPFMDELLAQRPEHPWLGDQQQACGLLIPHELRHLVDQAPSPTPLELSTMPLATVVE